jgi:hypothetical protein
LPPQGRQKALDLGPDRLRTIGPAIQLHCIAVALEIAAVM